MGVLGRPAGFCAALCRNVWHLVENTEGAPCLFLRASFLSETRGLPWEPRPSGLARLSRAAPGISK